MKALILIALLLVGCDKNGTDDKAVPVEEVVAIPDPAPKPPESDVPVIIIPEPTPEPIEVEPILYPEPDSEFIGRIVYEDKTPYVDGVVIVESIDPDDPWIYYSRTDTNGEFKVGAMGSLRFKFGAWSPFGDDIYYYFAIPLIVPPYDSSEAYECPIDIDIDTCYENEILRG